MWRAARAGAVVLLYGLTEYEAPVLGRVASKVWRFAGCAGKMAVKKWRAARLRPDPLRDNLSVLPNSL